MIPGLLQGIEGFNMGMSSSGPFGEPGQVLHSLAGFRSLRVVIREAVGHFIPSILVLGFRRTGGSLMEGLPALIDETRVGHLIRQGVRKDLAWFRTIRPFIEEFLLDELFQM